MARWLSEDIVDELSALGLAVADAKYRSAYDPEDVPGTAERLQRAADDVRRLGAHVKGSSNVQEFCDRVNDTGASTPKEVEQVAKVVKMCRQIVALEVVSEEAIVGRSALRELWVRPFQEAADELEARKDWVRFLAAMYDRLSKHDVQVRRKADLGPEIGIDYDGYLITTIEDVAMSIFIRLTYMRTSFQASRRALGPFADLGAIEAKAQALGLPAKLRPAAVNLQDANALVSMVSREPERECNDDSGELVVRGESVSVSEALATGCGGGARTVHIYATNTVFVDADVALPGGRLVIVAPRWEVLGSPKIDLNGQPGPDAGGKPGPPDSGSRGADGEAGGPGSPGGSFLGVGATFIGNKPRVTADGGRGGRGRDGGDGGSGSPGGGDGGDGGDGGVGGLGGQRGRALFVNLVGQVFQNDVSTADGPRGDGGRGGYGGTSTAHSARRRRRRRQDEAPSWIPSAISAVADVAKALINRPDRHGGEQAPAPPPPPVYHDGRPGRDNSAGSPEPPAQPLPTLWQSVPPRVLQHAESSADHPYRRRDIQRYLQELRASTAFMTLA
ncbi:hypothetical protein ONE63_004509 [Megalurothrips usitatus]|uniref:Uncharacterized protein n=1 Tax=Megalurothrips usitatus TaxID=439358 RepID=A0AAV7X5J5_9NEOP|nr:hypothetical protein ONE63_004509 [Megalurothrips usitatus]